MAKYQTWYHLFSDLALDYTAKIDGYLNWWTSLYISQLKLAFYLRYITLI